MKNLLSVTLLLALSTTAALATEGSSTAEKCILVSAQQDSNNSYDALMGVTAINIYNEISFMQAGDISFPKQNTMITFSFKNDAQKNIIGDKLFKTIQTTAFTTADNKPATIDKLDFNIPFITSYSHIYSLKQPMRELTIVATHSVAQVTDHSASKDVIVDYSDTQKMPFSQSTFKGKFTFRCNEFKGALEILNEK